VIRDLIYTLVLMTLFAFGATAQQTPTPAATPSATPVTKKVNERQDDKAAAEPFDKVSIQAMATRCVTISTEIGDIYLELYPESAPETVRNFLNLAIHGAYDGTTFSRVVPGFVIQGGNIFTREVINVTPGLVKRAARTIVDEPNKILHERGIVSMARPDEPDQASTHFFILVQSAPSLDGKYAAFGKVLRGMEVVDAINKAAVEGEKPVKPVHVRKADVDACVRPANQ
jgi:peptidyl-prolyl cis-trans isomerase B (cyclophilin B)